MNNQTEIIRCGWVGINKPHYEKYHDEEWGVAVHNDHKHFEMLILEGAQAGINYSAPRDRVLEQA